MFRDLEYYVDLVKQKYYSRVSKKEIRNVLKVGLAKFFELNKKGLDSYHANNKYEAYCGKTFLDHKKKFKYSLWKNITKLRARYKYNGELYDGVYYFCLGKEEYEHFLEVNKKKTRNFIFENIKLHKIKEECFAHTFGSYYFEVYYPIDVGWSFWKDKLVVDKYKIIAKRDENKKLTMV